MSNTFTLDALQKETRKKYEPVKIILEDGSSVELKPLIRLGSLARKAVIESIKDMNELDSEESTEEDEDELADEYAQRICDSISKLLKLIATPHRKLIAQLDAEEDIRIRSELYTSILRHWTGETQVGEAQSSPS